MCLLSQGVYCVYFLVIAIAMFCYEGNWDKYCVYLIGLLCLFLGYCDCYVLLQMLYHAIMKFSALIHMQLMDLLIWETHIGRSEELVKLFQNIYDS